MALTVRYFSTAAAGTGDGTTWANRAALFSSGNWSSVITGFAFGSDALECRIGPGSYACTQTLNTTTITTDPTRANFILLHGCDSSGNRLAPIDTDWTSDIGAWDDSSLATISTTTNIATISLIHCYVRLLRFNATSANQNVVQASAVDWCSVVNQQNSTTGVVGVQVPNGGVLSNSIVSCTGAAYEQVIFVNQGAVFNCRATGVTGTTRGRNGIEFASTIGSSNGYASAYGCTVTGCGGAGIAITTANAAVRVSVSRCTVYSVGGSCYLGNSTASQTDRQVITGCVGVSGGAYGVDASSSGIVLTNSRFRNNATANFNGFGNYPTDLDIYTTAASDSDDFVNAAGGNYQIKSTAGFANRNIGVSQEATAASGGLRRVFSGGVF
jgi:hypothetical protein